MYVTGVEEGDAVRGTGLAEMVSGQFCIVNFFPS
jgi:hypothetical protein